jgi:hypothetical protein
LEWLITRPDSACSISEGVIKWTIRDLMNRKHKECYLSIPGGGVCVCVKSFFYKPFVRVEWNFNLDSRIVPFAKGVMKKKN